MRAAFAIAALAGSAVAAPGYDRPKGPNGGLYRTTQVETVVHTVYVTEGYGHGHGWGPKHSPTPSPSSSQEAAPSSSVVVEPSSQYEEPPKPTPTPEAPTPTPEVPYPTPTPETPKPSPSPAPPANDGYMAIVDEYRGKMGMKALTWSAKLEANAKDVVASGKGVMVHKLNPGTYGQVLAPGPIDEFKHVFVGGWLCEIPTLPGLTNECETQSNGWNYKGQTGHAEILTSPNYSEIACAHEQGIWCCDVA